MINRILLYAPLVTLLIIGAWLIKTEQSLPESYEPIISLLVGIMFYGFGRNSDQEGEIGSGNSKIRQDSHPNIFKISIYLIYVCSFTFIGWAVYSYFI